MKIEIKPQSYDTLILLAIVFIGLVLRFYDFFNIPMTHDELSALYRLKFDTFYELIEKGVKTDGHPAGVQVFLYYWTTLFGIEDSVVKLPFLIFGLGSIVLSYLVAKKWFNSTTGLLTAAFMASLQFTIMYSQIARPYVSGLFFCLLMVFFWTQYLFENKHKKIIDLTGFILSAFVCCYNHYFSLLFAFIVGITGLFFIRKGYVKLYLLSLVVILLLYIPHLNIFFHQLENKGLEWLLKPEDSFITEHFKYIFHFNPLVYLYVIIIPILGIYKNKSSSFSINKFQVIAIVWFIVPILVGLVYSIYVKPIIQHSMLIFSFPYLLLFLFSFIKHISTKLKTIILTIILFINISSLIFTRQHYSIFYKQPFKEFAILTKNFVVEHKPGDVTIFLNENPKYIDHYFLKYNTHLKYTSLYNGNLGPAEFRKKIALEKSEYIISGNAPMEYISIIREYYPSLIFKDFGFTYEFYIFSKKPIDTNYPPIEDIISTNSMGHGDYIKNWSNIENAIIDSSNNQIICSLSPSLEWGPTFEVDLYDIIKSRYDFIDISIDSKSSDINLGRLVYNIIKEDTSVIWHSVPLHNYYDSTIANDWQRAHLSLRLTNFFKKNNEMKNCKLRVFFWNINKEAILLNNFIIQSREGNNKVYSLFENIE